MRLDRVENEQIERIREMYVNQIERMREEMRGEGRERQSREGWRGKGR